MRISVISFKGSAPALPIEFDFDSRGGTIGRDAGNQLVLPDPERQVSRLQASVEHDGGRFLLVDHGSNPTLVDGRALGKGASVELHGGERIAIGPYLLEVDRIAAPPPEAAITDPLGLFGAGSGPVQDDPFARYVRPQAAAAAPPDEDPFAVFAPQPREAPAPPADEPGLGAEIQEPSVDALFGLERRPGEPLAGTPLAQNAAAPSVAVLDPLALFGAPSAASQAEPVRDDAPLLSQAYTPPSPRPPEAESLKPDGRAAPQAPAAGMVFSWEAQPAARPRPSIPESRCEPTQLQPAPVPAPAAKGKNPDADPLLAAFSDGLGIELDLTLTPELMRQVGAMLREATQGTLDLMQARALTKRELRAEQTMIVSKGNNPLKFSPDLAFALMQLLTGRSAGFMRADEAMRDAYDDLRAHQFGFIAGMRAALAGVLQRFTPAEIEQRVAARGLLDNLLPASRKARMWDLFEAKYADISREAADDFHALFGREFLRAYEEQVDRLREGRDA